MRLPGFTAQAALAGSGRHLLGRILDLPAKAGVVVPAAEPHWGGFKDDHCTKMADCNPDGSCAPNGKRQFSAILWDIPWGRDWQAFCENDAPPAFIRGQTFNKPNRCVHSGFNMWGEFDVPDPTCFCGTGYPVCLPQPSGCLSMTMFACSEQQARAGCAALPKCRFNSQCYSGRCS